MTMFDIHCHVLPNIDDGATNLDMSLKMLRQAQKEGILGIVCTPHAGLPNNSNINEIRHRFDILKKEVRAAGIHIDLYLGSEIHCTKSTIKMMNTNQLLTINNSRYILLELSFEKYRSEYEDIIYDLVISGKTPIIAHIERYPYVQANPNIAYDLIEKGCLIQVNQDSLLGKNGSAIQTIAHLLIEHHLVHFVCSDAHNLQRNITLKEAHRQVIHRYSVDYAFELFGRNALCVIQNQNVILRLPYRIKDSSRFLCMLKQVSTQLVGIR